MRMRGQYPARAQEAVRDRALQAAVALRPTRKRSRQPFFSALALCAASFPDLPLLTMYQGSSLEAATLWPLTFVGVVCFLTTLPVL